MRSPTFPEEFAEIQTLDDVRRWRQDVAGSVLNRTTSLKVAIRTSAKVPPRFVGMTESDVDLWYEATIRELDRLSIFSFVASAEAAIRTDYFS